jgi:hypothetical protein
MIEGGGWSFYVNDRGRFRNFMIGEENEETAKLILQSQFPHINFLNFETKERVRADVIKMLGLTDGKGCEWSMGDPKESMRPRGVAMDRKA